MASPDGPNRDSNLRDSAENRLVDWQLIPVPELPDGWVNTVAEITGLPNPIRGAQLLWMRGIQSAAALRGFLQATAYCPASPFEFGEEIQWAVDRLMVARDRTEKVAIWGDFDADGITATAVLWDGLRQFFTGEGQLTYFIPNRLKESHGLSVMGIDQLAAQGVQLIVTCDTGSTNPDEVEHAQSLGIDMIVTDHHTLPKTRPAVVAIVNPRALPSDHAMASLSGVAVAYKLVEALYEKLPTVPSRPLHELVDLVAIGLIADLVELKGDCRYLAQTGIEQLQTQLTTEPPIRPGVAQLLKLCRRAGDRPTDISFGIGPRINAVSRIYGDASFCVELLTSDNPERCQELAGKAELANARRKALQNDVFQQVSEQLAHRDLSTTGVIVLCDSQWPVGVLGLVAGQVAQQHGKPTILLTQDAPEASLNSANPASASPLLARGSARSVNQVDLYDLVHSQAHLLTGFGGHPFAAGLSLPVENLPLFQAAINQQYRQKVGSQMSAPTLKADLTVTVAELGKALFQELKLLEPCGMGNPVPKLLIKNCWFENVWHQKLKDRLGSKVGYIKATFQLCDESGDEGGSGRRLASQSARCPGLWWGHYKDDLPPGRWDAIAELDFNSHPKSRRYEVRLIDIRPAATQSDLVQSAAAQSATARSMADDHWLLDRRYAAGAASPLTPFLELPSEPSLKPLPPEPSLEPIEAVTDLVVDDCPTQWKVLRLWQHQSYQKRQPVALAYPSPDVVNPVDVWTQLLGLAKYLARAQQAVSRERLAEKLEVSDRTLEIGLSALSEAGFTVDISAIDLRFRYGSATDSSPDSSSATDASEPKNASGGPSNRPLDHALSHFLAAVQEDSFRRQYFYQAPVSTLQSVVSTAADLD
ncbi:MAG: single-stranded-DNA-specific exonuclease RecJ [Phormidesmis sp.]